MRLSSIVEAELTSAFSSFVTSEQFDSLRRSVVRTMEEQLDKTTIMDNVDRMNTIASSSSSVLLKFFTGPGAPALPSSCNFLNITSTFQSSVASQSAVLMDGLRKAYLSGEHGPAPASPYLGKTRPVYEYIRKDLGVRMHGSENYSNFTNVEDVTIGQNISRVFEVCHLSFVVNLAHPSCSGHSGWENAIHHRLSF